MSTMRNLLVYLTLFIVQSIAEPSVDEGFDDWFYDNGRPSTSSSDKCIKDLLLLVDTSYSIGQRSFNDDVKPFLERLVTDPTLNIGQDGTQLSMIIFSMASRTKILLNFGDIYDRNELAKYMKNLQWEQVSGDRTRTDLALEIGNDRIFSKRSPGNNRPDIDDVVVIITDGEPRGPRNAKTEAIRYAGLLKDKHVVIIGAAIGPQRELFKDILIKIATSKEYTVSADFENMDEIIGTLVASSCTKPGECICQVTETIVDAKPGESGARISWPKPKYLCKTGRVAEEQSYTIVPPYYSPYVFSIGKHTITYIFKLKGGVEVTCPMVFKVRGELCRGKPFNSKTQVCCCGTVHTMKRGHTCCGPDYYSISKQKCCSNVNLVSREKSCPNA